MPPTTGVALTLLTDAELRDNAERVAAAVGVRTSAGPAILTRKAWLAAAAVVLDEDAARRCQRDGMPRRDGIILLSAGEPEEPSVWRAAAGIGAQYICALPGQEPDFVRHLSEVAEAARGADRSGWVVAVTPARGGAGASVFAAALGQAGTEALLVDLDPWGGGIDLLLGGESVPGLRWPDLGLQGGRLAWSAVRDAVPNLRGVSVLSGARHSHEPGAGPVAAVLDAGRRGGATVICDVPRRMTDPEIAAFDSADLVVAVTTCDVRGVAAASAVVPVLRAVNPNVGLVVRGPSPGGLRAAEVAEVAEVPLLAAMRPEPMLAERLEQGGLRLRRRSPLAAAARQVLELLPRRTGVRAA
ncbi:MAG: helicase [Mycobacterium sp.]|nr:helicase [Mycobacterium sp.]